MLNVIKVKYPPTLQTITFSNLIIRDYKKKTLLSSTFPIIFYYDRSWS